MFIIQVEPGSLSKKKAQESCVRLNELAPYIDDSSVLKRMLCDQTMESKIIYIFKSFRYNRHLLYFLYDHFKKDDSILGYVPIDKRFNPEKSKRTKNVANEVQRIDPDSLTMLRDMIGYAKGEGVKIVLAATPRLPEDDFDLKYEAECFNVISNIAEENNVSYINISFEKYPQLQDVRLYADAAHLNRDGAKIFSQLFSQELINKEIAFKPGE